MAALVGGQVQAQISLLDLCGRRWGGQSNEDEKWNQ